MNVSGYESLAIGVSYVSFGLIGFVCNIATGSRLTVAHTPIIVIMIATNRVYRLSAYTLMGNVALADSIMMLIAGVAVGSSFLSSVDERVSPTVIGPIYNDSNNANNVLSVKSDAMAVMLSFCEIAAWSAGVISYALLAALGSTPVPLMGIRRDMLSFSFLETHPDDEGRSQIFMILMLIINGIGVGVQWICSTLVLMRIRRVKQKISRNKINQNSANRFKKQARLTFQFFYPSLLCTVASVLYFSKPYIIKYLNEWQFVVLHLIWLCNHACNPFIYAYFNDRMRLTYKEMLTCAALRYELRKRRISHGFRHNPRHNVSKRSNAPRSTRMSARSVRSRDGNFVRNSLQLQSRDFEQLCEFIMRVNPLYDSSEGWRESSDDGDFAPEMTRAPESTADMDSTAAAAVAVSNRDGRSIVLDLGRQTVEHWVRFAKKASI